ncbi:MAG: hemolysin family protein [Candidatus ainarchaeum sp.]|nr:hemolysin family protein [Candidatus ainarchaeum sp.]
MLIQIVILFFLLILSALFSATETAFYSVNRFKVEKLVKKKMVNAILLQELKRKQNKVLITILVMNNVVNIGAASIAASIMLQIFPENIGIAVSTFIMTLLILIFGEITPKSFAAKNSTKFILFIAPILSWIVFLLSPITWFLEKITKIFVGVHSNDILTEEEIRMVIALGHKEGAIDEEEKEMIQNVFRLDDLSVEQVMTPRMEMIVVEKDKTLNQLKNFLKTTPYSKIPVYDIKTDMIIGIFNVRSALKFINRKLDVKVSSLMESALFIPSSKKIGSLLKKFQEKKIHIAIVVGEYGGIQGLITLEDILEELVGEITESKDDEYDMKIINEKTIIVEGGTELETINKELNLNLSSKKFNTIAGFLLEKIDYFPKKGKKFNFNNIKFEITKASQNKIEEVKISK